MTETGETQRGSLNCGNGDGEGVITGCEGAVMERARETRPKGDEGVAARVEGGEKGGQ